MFWHTAIVPYITAQQQCKLDCTALGSSLHIAGLPLSLLNRINESTASDKQAHRMWLTGITSAQLFYHLDETEAVILLKNCAQQGSYHDN